MEKQSQLQMLIHSLYNNKEISLTEEFRKQLLETAKQFSSTNEDFPSNQRKQSKRDWKIYPISASIRKSTIASPLRIAFEAIQRTYWVVNNCKSEISIRKNIKYAIF